MPSSECSSGEGTTVSSVYSCLSTMSQLSATLLCSAAYVSLLECADSAVSGNDASSRQLSTTPTPASFTASSATVGAELSDSVRDARVDDGWIQTPHTTQLLINHNNLQILPVLLNCIVNMAAWVYLAYNIISSHTNPTVLPQLPDTQPTTMAFKHHCC